MSRNLKVSVLVCTLAMLLFSASVMASYDVAVFDGTEQKMAYNSKNGVYTISSFGGWGDNASIEYRAFLDFDLSSLNGHIGFTSIQTIEFFYDAGLTAVVSPGPSSFTGDIYIGQFMDDGLSAADWNAGDYETSQSWNSAPTDTWITLGQEALLQFFVFKEGSIRLLAPDHFSLAIRNGANDDFMAGLERRCKIRVTYSRIFSDKAAEETSTFGSVKSLYR